MRTNEALAQLILTVEALLDTLEALSQMSALLWSLHDSSHLASQKKIAASISILAQRLDAEGRRYAESLRKAKQLFAPLGALVIEEKEKLNDG